MDKKVVEDKTGTADDPHNEVYRGLLKIKSELICSMDQPLSSPRRYYTTHQNVHSIFFFITTIIHSTFSSLLLESIPLSLVE